MSTLPSAHPGLGGGADCSGIIQALPPLCFWVPSLPQRFYPAGALISWPRGVWLWGNYPGAPALWILTWPPPARAGRSSVCVLRPPRETVWG